MAFYNASQFPAGYRGSAFVALHGSWNREHPTGYKVVRIVFRDGQPDHFEDFLTGFLVQRQGPNRPTGRPRGHEGRRVARQRRRQRRDLSRQLWRRQHVLKHDEQRSRGANA